MEKYGGPREDRCGFKILGFPCNQFGRQEPGENPDEILNGLKYVRPGNGFKPVFPLMEKLDVNGAKQHQMYTYLKVKLQLLHLRCLSSRLSMTSLTFIFFFFLLPITIN